MNRLTLFFALFFITAIHSPAVYANEMGLVPPDLDYQAICKTREKVELNEQLADQDFSKLSKLSLKRLIGLASFYYRGHQEAAPNYERAKTVVNYIIANKQKIQDETDIDYYYDAFFLKHSMLVRGKGFKQNTNEAKKILDHLIKNQEPKAHAWYARLYTNEGNFEKAAEHYKKSIVKGHVSSVFDLAEMYYKKQVPVSDEQVKQIVIQAQNTALRYVALGSCDVMTRMGLMYRTMSDLPRAEYFSAKWFEKSALLDDTLATLHLAHIIKRGFVLQDSEYKVLDLWESAANSGSTKAMFLLGEHYILNYQNETEKDFAIKWLEKAALYRNLGAAQFLADVYLGMHGVEKNTTQRQKWLEHAVKHEKVGSKTLLNLASLYETIGYEPKERITELYFKAASKKSDKAYIKLGNSYRYGHGVERNPTRALRYYRLAANNGVTEAMKALKQAYECEIGKTYDPQKVAFWNSQLNYFNDDGLLREAQKDILHAPTPLTQSIMNRLNFFALSRNSERSMIMLGFYFQKLNKPKQAQAWFDKALNLDKQKNDEYSAHHFLGKMYLEGTIVKQDMKQAVAYIQEATNVNNPGAHNDLGKILKTRGQFDKAELSLIFAGQEGKISAYVTLSKIYREQGKLPEAVALLERASKQNNVPAMLILSDGYDRGGWIGEDSTEKASKWFNQAINSYPCDPKDIIKISQSYAHGKNGAPKDPAQSEVWIKKVIDAVWEKDKERLVIARTILQSEGLMAQEVYSNKALGILEKLAQKNNSESLQLLSDYYLNTINQAQDQNAAIKWLEKSAKLGNIEAMLELSNLYISGYKIEQSTEKAVYWLTQAKEKGSQQAANRLRIISQ